MKNKFIIYNNWHYLSDLEAFNLVMEVIKLGKVSNNDTEYCYCTNFTFDKDIYQVSHSLNKKSEKFIINKIK